MLAEQSGWPVTVLCGLGMLLTVVSRKCRQYGVFLALLLATYVTFTPLAELRSRHAIYWLPAVAFFAVIAIDWLCRVVTDGFRRVPRLVATALMYSLLLSTTALSSLQEPSFRVEGYQAAAQKVLDLTQSGDRVFFDGWWDGNFTYHMRHLDPSRSRHVIRGDRLLYDFLCVPSTDFRQYVDNDDEILKTLAAAAPAYVVIENPQFYETIAVAQQLRDLIDARPDVFVPVESVRVASSITYQPEFRLEIFRFRPEAITPPDSGQR